MNTAHIALTCALFLGPQDPKTTRPEDPIEKPPANLSYAGFYTKCVYWHGMPIVASSKVDDKALRTLVDRLSKLMAKVPESSIQFLVKRKVHYSIIADEEGQTDLPEYRHLKNDKNTDWDKRARGLGGNPVSAAEENILEYSSDRYKGESIYIHEFAHTLDSEVFRQADPNFRKELREAYDKAIKAGLWKNTYSASNPGEYFAEGVQMYFDCARGASPPNGVHNEIINREGLKGYDKGLYDLVDKCFGGNPWRYEGSYCTTGKKVGG